MKVIIETSAPGPWFEIDGEGGGMEELDGILVVRQTQQNHRTIEKLLKKLRAAKKTGAKIWMNIPQKVFPPAGFGANFSGGAIGNPPANSIPFK